MMTVAFNLIAEPFIPCVRPNGQVVPYGLRDVLLKAHEIAELRDGSPLVTVALHRLLLAILHHCYEGPKNTAERVTIRDAGCFDPDRIARYFEYRADKFDLFHEKYPFYQRAGYVQDKPSGANRLVKELSRGNNPTLFDHTTDDPPMALAPAQAARAVITEQMFAYSAGKGKTGEPHTLDAPTGRAAAVFTLGNTLFETLWLNLTIYNSDDKPIACDEDDGPIWERQPMPPYEDTKTPRGYLDFLTWQSRTIRLHPEIDGDQIAVRQVFYSQGRVWEQVAGFYDPFVAYERVPDVGDRALQFRENRDLWRDSAALFQFGETDQFRGTTCMHTLGNLVSDRHLAASDRYRVMVAGARVEPGHPNLIFWRHESLPLPLVYLSDVALVGCLKQALRLAEKVARILRSATYQAVIQIKRDTGPTKPEEGETALDFTSGNDRLKKKKPDPIGARVKALAPERGYWSRLEPRFRDLLPKLAEATDAEARSREIGRWFHADLSFLAKEAFTAVVRALSGSQRELHGVAVGENQLNRRLRKLGRQLFDPVHPKLEVTHDD